jgi:hypothetical protein
MYIDENGTGHPSDSDPWDTYARAHLSFCKTCNPYADVALRELLYKVWAAGCIAGLKTKHGWETDTLEHNPYKE